MNASTHLAGYMTARALGHFPLSMATSLALEISLGVGTQPVEKPTTVNQLAKLDEVWINIRTLARNIFNAVETSSKDSVTPEAMSDTLLQECEAIAGMEEDLFGGKPIHFYCCTLKGLQAAYKRADFRLANTEKQKHEAEVTNKAIDMFLKEVKRRDQESSAEQASVQVFDYCILPKERKNAAILTHMLSDLTRYRMFNNPKLLESHTGKLKSRDLWYTKFHNGNELAFLPFNAATLQIFGDSYTFKPMDQKVRSAIVALSAKKKWNPSTTEDGFKQSIQFEKDKFMADVISDMLRV